MSRVTPYLSKPPPRWNALLEQLYNSTLFLVARNGPTVFMVKDESGGVFRCTCATVSVKPGKRHRVDSSVDAANGTTVPAPTAEEGSDQSKTADLCLHVLFCLVKVLKVPREHALTYQTSLTDNELNQCLDGVHALQTNPSSSSANPRRITEFLRRGGAGRYQSGSDPGGSSDGKEVSVQRQALCEDQEEMCPICQDEMKAAQVLTWCRAGCGNNAHAKCMLQFAQFKTSNKQTPTCPLCREEWNMDLLKQDCKGKATLKNTCVPVHCFTCSCLLRAAFVRCIECSQLSSKRRAGATDKAKIFTDFCDHCFANLNSSHDGHHFLSSSSAYERVDEVCWEAKAHPSQPSQSLLDVSSIGSLLSREITNSDYELLLSLDNAIGGPSIASNLIEALPVPMGASISSGGGGTERPGGQAHVRISKSCWCNAVAGSCRILPCNHTAHELCLQKDIAAIVQEQAGMNGRELSQYACRHEDCGALVFPCLGRHRQKRRSSIDTSSVSSTSGMPSSDHSNSGHSSGVVRVRDSSGGNLLALNGVVGSGIALAGVGRSDPVSLSSSSSRHVHVVRPSIGRGNNFTGMRVGNLEVDPTAGVSLSVGGTSMTSSSSSTSSASVRRRSLQIGDGFLDDDYRGPFLRCLPAADGIAALSGDSKRRGAASSKGVLRSTRGRLKALCWSEGKSLEGDELLQRSAHMTVAASSSLGVDPPSTVFPPGRVRSAKEAPTLPRITATSSLPLGGGGGESLASAPLLTTGRYIIARPNPSKKANEVGSITRVTRSLATMAMQSREDRVEGDWPLLAIHSTSNIAPPSSAPSLQSSSSSSSSPPPSQTRGRIHRGSSHIVSKLPTPPTPLGALYNSAHDFAGPSVLSCLSPLSPIPSNEERVNTSDALIMSIRRNLHS